MNVINHMLTIVLDPEVFENRDEFVAETEKFVAYIKATTPAVDAESVMIPGDPERKTRTLRPGV